MIVSTPEGLRAALREMHLPADLPPTMRSAFLISPEGFRLVEQSSPDNRYVQWESSVDTARALAQHAELEQTLLRLGVPVRVLPGVPELPDGVFPNNAFATVPRRLVVGSMRHPLRRSETRRSEVWAYFRDELGYEVWDLEDDEVVAEMTGPLVIDRARGIGFCGMSERVNERGVHAMHEALGLRLTYRFDLQLAEYHTNVIMAILAGRALVLHAGSLMGADVVESLVEFHGGRTLLLDDDEKGAFAGNCIAATPSDVLMSTNALDALRPSSLAFFEARGFRLHGVQLDELEKAGGSLRCMVAEVF
ncbi:arginine deiminase-related protein [soil metagenome]